MSQPFLPPDTPLFRQLWAAQDGQCALCGGVMPRSRFEVAHSRLWQKWRPTFDHIRPRAKGGGDVPENLQLAHAQCNLVKGSDFAG